VEGRREDSSDPWVMYGSMSSAARALGIKNTGRISECLSKKKNQSRSSQSSMNGAGKAGKKKNSGVDSATGHTGSTGGFEFRWPLVPSAVPSPAPSLVRGGGGEGRGSGGDSGGDSGGGAKGQWGQRGQRGALWYESTRNKKERWAPEEVAAFERAMHMHGREYTIKGLYGKGCL
jgi:hypothetical protein